MKKVRYIVLFIIILIIGIGVCVGVSVTRSPEYALMKIARDVKETGIDGLMPHLTGDARETVTAISSISENKLLNAILSVLDKEDYVSVLKSNINKVDWEINDILRGHKKANVILSFNYEDKLVGTIEVIMIRERDGWKISGVEMPEFEEIDF